MAETILWASDYTDAIKQSITTAGYRTLNTVRGSGKHWTTMIDLVHVVDSILNERVHSFVVAGYLVVFGIGVPWYNPEHKLFEEQLVMAISEHPGNFKRVVKAMETVAVANNCTGVVVGTGLTLDKRLLQVYQRLGFNIEAQSLFKEV